FDVVPQLDYPAVLIPCGFSALGHPAFEAYFAAMPEVLRRYAHIVFHGSRYRDAEFARQHAVQHFSIIPNGASRAEFESTSAPFRQSYGIPNDRLLLLTVGSHTGEKGHREAIDAFGRARIGRA